jgi:hypothetical protein
VAAGGIASGCSCSCGCGCGCDCDENGFCCGNPNGVGIGSEGLAIGGCGNGIGSDDCGTGLGSDGRVAAATAAVPHEPDAIGGALPIGDSDGGVLATGALGLAWLSLGIGIGARDRALAAVGTGALNSTGSDEIARGFANGMTFVGAEVTPPDRIDGSGAAE